jgi:hypothetical protein
MTPDINALLLEIRRYMGEMPIHDEDRNSCVPCKFRKQIDAFLAADLVAVPKEPTEAMREAGESQYSPDITTADWACATYRAMIAAAEGE